MDDFLLISPTFLLQEDKNSDTASLESQMPSKDQLHPTDRHFIETSFDNEICLVSNKFPPVILQWCGLITRYANKHGLPPDLVAALILQESGGNPLAFSNSGAVGLMQVMPRDGIAASFVCINGPCFENRPTTLELQDPEYNIAYGTKLLAGLYNRYGDMREALKNYGPKDVGYYYADIVFHLFNEYALIQNSN